MYRSYIDAFKTNREFISPSGDGFVDVYELKEDEKSKNEILVKTGKKNLQEEIQAYEESTEIGNIINRFINGETDLLHKVNGDYIDVRNAPTSYAEYFEKVKEAQKIFDQLPIDIKNKFDNDPEKFFLEFGTDSFNEKVSENNEVIEPMSNIQEEFDNAE